MVLTHTRRGLITLFMVLAMLWAISATSLAGNGRGGGIWRGGGNPPTCTQGCLQNITWE